MRKFLGRVQETLGRLLVPLAALVVGVVAFMFSLVVVAGLAAVGLLLWGWIMWRTRDLRREMRARQAEVSAAGSGGAVIDGEYVEITRVVGEIKDAVPPEGR